MRKNYSNVLIALLSIAFLSFIAYNYIQDVRENRLTITSDGDAGEEGGKHNRQEELKERLEHERLMTMDPSLGYAPVERLVEAEKQAQLISAANSRILSPMALLNWTERGPSNLGGRSRSVLINRSDATGNTVFVGSVGGGLWKTTNFKSGSPTWTQISSVSANLAITALAQDPSNLNVMYAGTGEGYGNIDAIRGLGIYRSADGGNTWSLLPSTTTGGTNATDFSYVQDIVVYSNGHVYASGISAIFCNSGGILKSTNGGTSWTRVIGTYNNPPGGCNNAFDFLGYDLEISAGGDIYATVVDQSAFPTVAGKIYRSPAGATVGNAGTWLNITPAPKAGGFWQRIDVACAPSDNNVVYALFQGTGSAIDSIMRSDNMGGAWVNVDNTTPWCDQGTASSLDFSRGQAWYDLIIAVKPDDPATALAGGVDIMKTSNSGALWTQITQWNINCPSPPPTPQLPNVHADIHNIVYFPTGLGTTNEFIVVNDGGIYYTADGGASFTNKSTGYNTIQYYATDIHPTAGSNYMLAGAQDNGSHKFSAAGLGAITTASGGDGGFCHIDSDDPNIQVTSYTNSQWAYSRNGGASFSNAILNGNGRFINPSTWESTNNFLYAGYSSRQIVRINNIASGTLSANSFTVVPGATAHMASALKADPNTVNRIWVAFSTTPGSASVVPVLYYIDGANNFPTATTTQVTVPAGLAAGSYISSIDVEIGDPNHLLMTLSNYGVNSVWESTDLGANWTSIEGNLPDMPVRWGTFIPNGFNPGARVDAVGGVLLATELGVWSTGRLNGINTSWTQNATSMGNVRVDMVKIRSSDKVVAAATHGRGLFTASLLFGNLPVNFTAFTGKAEDKLNRLMWSVENEVNNKGYEVERKYKHEQGFTKIGFVASKSQNADANDYTFPDGLVDLGVDNVSYRLKQIDIDGQFKYSAVVNLTRKVSPKFVEYIAVRGNSMLVRMNGQSNQQLTYRLFDSNGRLLQQKQLQHATQDISLLGLPHGTFVVELSVPDGRRHTQKVVY